LQDPALAKFRDKLFSEVQGLMLAAVQAVCKDYETTFVDGVKIFSKQSAPLGQLLEHNQKSNREPINDPMSLSELVSSEVADVFFLYATKILSTAKPMEECMTEIVQSRALLAKDIETLESFVAMMQKCYFTHPVDAGRFRGSPHAFT
jgi:hypothetical protein